MKFWLLLLALTASTQAVSFFDLVMEEWESWKITHAKTYNTTTEEKFRLNIYMENSAKIAKHNHRAELGHHTYFLKMNHFGDLLHHEFAAKMNGYRPDLRPLTGDGEPQRGSTFIAADNVVLPKSVDWRTKGAVTPVKDQGHCGSCWAFSTTGSLEGQTFRKTGKLVSLSEQNLVDCSTTFGNQGCNGGLMDNAFKYIKANGGIDTEESYPYDAMDEPCHFKKRNVGAEDTGYVDVPQGNEDALAKAVASVGPVSIAIDASHQSFQFYSHGVYEEPECSPLQLDHGVLVVGYGEEEDGSKYWLVKNSWNTSWGDMGYIKMAKDKDNMCGVASSASYPLV